MDDREHRCGDCGGPMHQTGPTSWHCDCCPYCPHYGVCKLGHQGCSRDAEGSCTIAYIDALEQENKRLADNVENQKEGT